jgi:AcrR family transcriptional regulator
MADEKLTRTVEAAGEVFLRYGYARTTMGDIAKAAGMSRPALYLLFPGKEQVFSAATMHLAKQRLEEIRRAIAQCDGIEKKLVTACEMLLLSVYDLQQTAPDAKDMDDLEFPVVREIYTMFVDFFADIVSESPVTSTISAREIANVLLYGARGLRNVATSADEYRDMIKLHTVLLCASLHKAQFA